MEPTPLIYITANHLVNLNNVCHIKIAEGKIAIAFADGKTLILEGNDSENARKRLAPYFSKV